MDPQSSYRAEHDPRDEKDDLAPASLRWSTLAPLVPALLLFLAAIVLFRTWEEVLFIGSPSGLKPTSSSYQQVFFFAKGAAFVFCALLAERLERVRSRRPFYIAAAILLVASTSCKLLATGVPEQAAAFSFAASASGGVGIGIVMLSWFGMCKLFAPTLTISCYLASIVVGPLLMVFCYSLPAPCLMLACFALPLTSLAAMAAGFRAVPRETRDRRACVSHPYGNIVVLMAVFGFAFAFREPLLGNSLFASGSYTAFGSIAVAAALLFGIVLRGDRFDMALAFRIALPLTAVAFLLLPTDIPLTRTISDICSAASCKLVEVFAVLILAHLCHRFRMPTTKLFGFTFGAHFFGVFLGRYAWVVFGMLGVGDKDINVVFSIVAAGAIALAMLLMPGKDALVRWGLDEVDDGNSSDGDDRRLSHRCHDFAKEHGLTLREEEILLMLAQNKTNGEIQDELFISKETVKTHRRNLYAKCDVHSRDELVELLDSGR